MWPTLDTAFTRVRYGSIADYGCASSVAPRSKFVLCIDDDLNPCTSSIELLSTVGENLELTSVRDNTLLSPVEL